MTHFNGSHILAHIPWSDDSDWNLFSDASGRGYASVFGSKWVQGHFPDHWLPLSIAVKELLPIFIGFQLCAPEGGGRNRGRFAGGYGKDFAAVVRLWCGCGAAVIGRGSGGDRVEVWVGAG